MKMSGVVGALGIATMFGGCASTPTGPSVMVLPGTNKTMDQFQVDDARCRQSATAEMQREPRGPLPPQQRYDRTYMQCMYAAGNQIPGTGRTGYTTPGAAVPATGTGISQPPPPPAGAPPPPPPGPSR